MIPTFRTRSLSHAYARAILLRDAFEHAHQRDPYCSQDTLRLFRLNARAVAHYAQLLAQEAAQCAS